MSNEPRISSGNPIPPDNPRSSARPTPPNATAPVKSTPSLSPLELTFTRTAALWSSLISGFLILIVLLVFITQNTESISLAFLGWQWSLPLGVAILLAVVCGGLLTVLVGAARIAQLRRTAKQNLKAARHKS